MDPLFPELPQDLGALSDENLEELIAEHLAAIEKIRENDPKFIGELSGSEVIEQLRAGVEQVKTLRAEKESRSESEENYTDTVEALAAEVSVEVSAEAADENDEEESEEAAEEAAAEDADEEKEDEPEPAASVEEGEEEGVTADGQAKPLRRPAPSRERRGTSPGPSHASIRAAAGLPAFTPGQALTQIDLREALVSANEITSVKPGERTDVVVAQVHTRYPEERILDGRNASLNAERIYEAAGMAAVTADGGLCAPFPSFYDLPVISVADRPVRDALVSFQAARGGVSVPTPLSRADVAEGVDIVLASDDELGGTFATKNCVVIDCEPWTDYNIDSIYACVTHGNLNARAWPERVDAVDRLLAAQHATVAETNLLDIIGGASTQTTDGAVYGAVSTFLQGVLKAGAAYRSRHRTAAGVRLRALLPEWLVDMLLVDMIHGQFDRFHARSFITGLLSQAGIDAAFYKDTETGAGQVFTAQGAGQLLDFPAEVVWYLFAAGDWLFLDMGELNLGIVRDSVLNAQNNFQMFRETFEGAAFVGIESLRVETTICPNGAYPAGVTAVTC